MHDDAPARLLLVEDDARLAALVAESLRRKGWQVDVVGRGDLAIERIRTAPPDLVILDVNLPGGDGFDVCRAVRGGFPGAILMLTARDDDIDQVVGLELGADDYVAKPFSMKVLIARVRAALRRRQAPPAGRDAPVCIQDLQIHPGRHEVLVKGKPVEMTVSELRILHYLASRPGWVMTREQIVDAVRGEDYAVTDRSVDVQIVGIRRKLGPRADCIETVRGVGYRFREEE